MMWKKLMSVVLSAALLCTAIAGCGSSGISSQETSSQASSSQAESSQTTEEAPVSEYAGTQWWVGDEPITITGMGSLGTLYVNKKDYNEIPGIAEFSKRTNLYFDWTVMTSPENESEQINLSFASKKMPDFYMHINKNDAVKYGEQGALIDLMPLINEYAPNIKKALEADPTILPMMTTTDGKLYVIPQVDADYRLASFKMFVIQQAWLDKLELEAPETPEEFIEVLTAFKDNASELTDQVMIPYTSYMGNMEGFFDVFGWPYNMLSSKTYVKDDKLVYGVLEPEFKDTVKFVQELYSKGLIDPDLDASKDDPTFEAKMTNNRVGIAYVGQGRFGGYNSKAGATFDNFEFVPMLSMKNADGELVYPATSGLGKNMGLAISINNEHPIETIKAWDYFYSEEGMELTNFGFEGDTFEKTEDGHYTYTEKIMEDPEMNPNQGIMNKIFPLFDWPTARIYDFERSLYGEKLAEYKEIQYDEGAYHKQVLFSLSELPLSTEQVKQYAQVNTDINTYINECLVKFVRSDWTVEDNYDEFVSTLKSMGIEELLEVMNEGYALIK